MPRTTVRYQFEEKVFHWASSFSHLLTGTGEDRCFLILFDAQGAVLEIHTREVVNHLGTIQEERVVRRSEHQFFYNPFDAPEYTHIGWTNVPISALERLIGAPFESSDLNSLREGVDSLDSVPSSWNVMF